MTAEKQGKKDGHDERESAANFGIDDQCAGTDSYPLNQMDKRLDAIETRLDSMAEDITAIKENSAVTRTACNTLIKWNEHASAVVQVPYLYCRAE